MSAGRDLGWAVGTSALTGALILGLAGRAAMAAVAWATGYPVNLSPRGLVEVTVVGALMGTAGGFVLVAFRRLPRLARIRRGVFVGGTLFAGSLLVSSVSGKTSFGASASFVTLFVVAVIFVVFGVAADLLLTRFRGDADSSIG